MKDTPRTDEVAWPETGLVEGDFARELERELNEARAELVEMTARAASLAAYLPPDTLCGDIQKWRDEYKMAIDQRDRLAEALKKAKPIVSRYPSGWDLSHDELDDADKEIDEALQSLTTNAETIYGEKDSD